MALPSVALQSRLRSRIVAILVHEGPQQASTISARLQGEGYTPGQILVARRVVVECEGRGQHSMWRVADDADLPVGPMESWTPAPRAPVRGLARCEECGFHIGYRAAGEPPLCLLCQEKSA